MTVWVCVTVSARCPGNRRNQKLKMEREKKVVAATKVCQFDSRGRLSSSSQEYRQMTFDCISTQYQKWCANQKVFPLSFSFRSDLIQKNFGSGRTKTKIPQRTPLAVTFPSSLGVFVGFSFGECHIWKRTRLSLLRCVLGAWVSQQNV